MSGVGKTENKSIIWIVVAFVVIAAVAFFVIKGKNKEKLASQPQPVIEQPYSES